MENLKNRLTFGLFALMIFGITACSNSNAKNETGTVEKLPVVAASFENNTEPAERNVPGKNSAFQTDLDKANEAGKAAFVVVTETGNSETGKAVELAESANSIFNNAVVLQMNRDDAANSELVQEWQLSGAPLPLILVVSSKGLPTGGRILAQATAENITELVPTPKLEMVYEAITNDKHAIVVFTKNSFSDKPETLKNCKEAVSMLENQAVLIEVDISDKNEKNFINQFRIDEQTTTGSITLVINKQGQVSGTSTTIPDARKLATAAVTPVRGGCGSGPAGCGQ